MASLYLRKKKKTTKTTIMMTRDSQANIHVLARDPQVKNILNTPKAAKISLPTSHTRRVIFSRRAMYQFSDV